MRACVSACQLSVGQPVRRSLAHFVWLALYRAGQTTGAWPQAAAVARFLPAGKSGIRPACRSVPLPQDDFITIQRYEGAEFLLSTLKLHAPAIGDSYHAGQVGRAGGIERR